MSTLLFARNDAGEVPANENDVRSTVNVVNNDASEAVAETSPDWNAAEHDPDTEGGMTTRAVADKVNPSERYAPHIGNANMDFAAPINTQVSTSGTAANREAAGRWGHGSLRWSEALEPTIREGGAFDNLYFAAHRPAIQDGSLDYMTAPRQPDAADSQATQQAVNAATREASKRALYQRFLEDRTS